ncbi:uncharacterized protein [Ptychodera flava]|uniref:uncharacterized protein isoform X2 n=1 Tax=Ptychodera flava TaxID=63121 RepID=UPI00396A3AA7
MDSLAGEDPTLPIDFDDSVNVHRLPVLATNGMNYSNEEWPDGPPSIAKASTGKKSPIMRMTVKDVESQLSTLKMQNFNLKLRIFHMEEQMHRELGGTGSEEIVNQNIELKIKVEQLHEELKTSQKLLAKAKQAFDDLDSEREVVGESAETIAKLKETISEYEKEIEQARKDMQEERVVHQKRIQQQVAEQLKGKDEVINQLYGDVQEKENMCKKLGEEVAKIKQELHDQKMESHKKRKEVDELILEKEGEIHRLANDVEEKDYHCKKLENEVEYLKKELQKQKMEVQKKSDDDLTEQLKEKDRLINKLNSDVNDKVRHCKAKNLLAESLKQKIVDQKRALEEHYSGLLEDQKQHIKQRERMIVELSRSLAEKEQLIKELMEKEASDQHNDSGKEVMIQSLRHALKQRDESLQEAIDDKYKALDLKDDEIRTIKVTLREKDQEIDDMNAEMEELRDSFTHLEGAVKERDAEIKMYKYLTSPNNIEAQHSKQAMERMTDEYNQSITEKNQVIRELEKANAEKDREIQKLLERGRERDRIHRQLQNGPVATTGSPQDTVYELKENIAKLESELDDKTAEIKLLKSEKPQSSIMDTMNDELDGKEEKLAKAEAIIDRLQDKNNRLDTEVDQLKKRSFELQNELKEKGKLVDSLIKAGNVKESLIKELEQKVDDIKQEQQAIPSSSTAPTNNKKIDDVIRKQLRELENLKTATHAEKVLYENMRLDSSFTSQDGSVDKESLQHKLDTVDLLRNTLEESIRESDNLRDRLEQQLSQSQGSSGIGSESETAHHVREIQSLKEEIQSLKEELEDLRYKNSKLESRLIATTGRNKTVGGTGNAVSPKLQTQQYSSRSQDTVDYPAPVTSATDLSSPERDVQRFHQRYRNAEEDDMEDGNDDGERSIPGQEDEDEVARMEYLAFLKKRVTELEIALKKVENQKISLQRQLDIAMELPDGSTEDVNKVIAILKEQLDQAKTLVYDKDQEIEKLRMKFIEKDARTSSYEELQRENDDMKSEIRLLTQEKTECEIQVEELSYQMGELQERYDEVREEVRNLQQEVKDMNQSRKQKHQALQDSYRALRSKDDEIESKQREIDELEEVIEDLKNNKETDNRAIMQENNDFRIELSRLEELKNQFEDSNTKLRRENEKLLSHVNKQKASMEVINSENKKLKADRDDFKYENNQLNAAINELQATLDEAREENSRLIDSSEQSHRTGDEIAKLSAANKELQAALEQIRKKNEKLTDDVDIIDNENYELTEKNSELCEKISDLTSKISKLNSQNSELDNDKMKLEVDLADYMKMIKNLKAELNTITEQKKSQDSKIAALSNKTEQLQSDLDKATKDNQYLESELSDTKKLKQRIEADLKDVRLVKNQLQEDNDHLKQEKEVLQKKVSEAQKENIKLASEIKAAKAQATDGKAKQDTIEADMQKIVMEKEGLQKEIASLKAEGSSKPVQLSFQDDNLLAKLNDLKKIQASMETQLKQVQEERKDLEMSNDLLRKQVKQNTNENASHSFNPQLIVDMATEIDRLNQELKRAREELNTYEKQQLAEIERLNAELKKASDELKTYEKQQVAEEVSGKASPSHKTWKEVNTAMRQQIELMRSQLQDADKNMKQLNAKLQATEATVRHLSNKLKMYRNRMKSAGIAPPTSPTFGRSSSENCIYEQDADLEPKWPSSPTVRDGEDVGFRTPSPKGSTTSADMFPEYGESQDPVELQEQVDDLKCQLDKSRRYVFMLQKKISQLVAGKAVSPPPGSSSTSEGEDAWFEFFASQEVIEKLQNEVQHLKRQLNHSKNLCESLLKEETSQRSDLKVMEAHKQSLKENIRLLDGQRKSLQTSMKDLENSVELLTAEKSVLTTDNMHLGELNETLKTENDSLKKDTASSKANYEEKLKVMTAHMEDLQKKLADLRKANDMLSAEKKELQRPAFEKGKQMKDIVYENDALQKQLSESRNISKMLHDHLEQLVQSLTNLVQQNQHGEWMITSKLTPRKLGILRSKVEHSKKLFSDLDDTLSESRSSTYLGQISQTDLRGSPRWRDPSPVSRSGYDSDDSSLYSEGNARQLMQPCNVRSQSSQTSFSSTSSVRFADTHTMAEYDHLREKLQETNALNETLKAELEVYKKVAFDKEVSFDGARDTDSTLAEHLAEVCVLRQRLEESIDTNDKLRQQLEAKLAAASDEKGNTTILYLQQTNAELTEEIGDLRRRVADKDMLLTDKDKLLTDKDKLLNDKDKLLANKDKLLADKDKQLSGKDSTLKDTEKILDKVKMDFAKAKHELKRMKEEAKRWREQYDEKSDLNKSLKLELTFLEKLAMKADGKSRGSPSSKDSHGLDLTKLMTELRHLRIQLERSIETNNALRVKLEQLSDEKLSPGSKVTIVTSGSPSRKLSPKQLFDDKFEEGKMRNASSMPILYTGRTSPKSSPHSGRDSPYKHQKRDARSGRDSPTTRHTKSYGTVQSDDYDMLGIGPLKTENDDIPMFSDKSGAGAVYAIGSLNDYNNLKDQLKEMKVILNGMEARVKGRKRQVVKGTTEYTMLREMTHSVHTLRSFLDEATTLLSFFRIDQLPSMEEYLRQKKVIADQSSMIERATGRLHESNKMKERLEFGVIDKLTDTHNILSLARTNLQGQAKFLQTRENHSRDT